MKKWALRRIVLARADIRRKIHRAVRQHEKIWNDLSEKVRNIVELLARNGEIKVKDLRDALEMKSGAMSVSPLTESYCSAPLFSYMD